MKTLLGLLILFSISTESTIIGTVKDNNTNEELCGVRIINNKDTIYSDFEGKFEIKNNSDTIKLSFNYISYEKKDTILIKDIMLATK